MLGIGFFFLLINYLDYYHFDPQLTFDNPLKTCFLNEIIYYTLNLKTRRKIYIYLYFISMNALQLYLLHL